VTREHTEAAGTSSALSGFKSGRDDSGDRRVVLRARWTERRRRAVVKAGGIPLADSRSRIEVRVACARARISERRPRCTLARSDRLLVVLCGRSSSASRSLPTGSTIASYRVGAPGSACARHGGTATAAKCGRGARCAARGMAALAGARDALRGRDRADPPRVDLRPHTSTGGAHTRCTWRARRSRCRRARFQRGTRSRSTPTIRRTWRGDA